MDRKLFLQSLAVLSLVTTAMKLNELNKMTAPFNSTAQIPVLF